MKRYAFLVDKNKCTGCRMCVMACTLGKEGECSRTLSRIRIESIEEKGIDKPVVCIHCEYPAPCETSCNFDAMTRNPSGIITIDHDLCTMCGACIKACPHEAIWTEPRTGKLLKCDFCNGNPRCLEYCPTNVIEIRRY